MDGQKYYYGQDLPDSLVHECLEANSYGDGILLKAILADKKGSRVLYDVGRKKFLVFEDGAHHYKIDNKNLILAWVEKVCMRYAAYSNAIQEQVSKAQAEKQTDRANYLAKIQQKIHRRIERLRGDRGRKACVDFLRTTEDNNSICVQSSEMDADPWLLAGPNGVLDLRTAEVRPGSPKDKCLKATPIPLPKDPLTETSPTLESFLWESLENQAKIDFLRRLFGYSLTGLIEEHIILILSSLNGGTGKTTLMELVSKAMGELCSSIRAELLLDPGRAQSSSAPTSDIMDLQGKRLVYASESDEARRFSPSRVKWLTGGDSLVGRRAHSPDEERFVPSHKLVLITNNEPHAPADDHAFWRRVLKVDFPYSFVDNPREGFEKKRDKLLQHKLQKELTGVLAWMIRGNIDWQHQGLNPPSEVKMAVEDYRRSEDLIQDWIDENCITETDPDQAHKLSETSNNLYKDFSNWFQEHHGKRVPSLQWFGRRMSKKFKKDKSRGSNTYFGVQLVSS